MRAMNVGGQNHRDPWFADFYKKSLEETKMIFNTKAGTPIFYPGTGTGGYHNNCISNLDSLQWCTTTFSAPA